MKDDDIINGIKTETGGDIDLLLYCIKITETRFSKDHIKAIQRVTDALGESVWEKGLFVLTFANHITMLGGGKKKTLDVYFSDTLLRWKSHLHASMEKDIGISPNVIENIPVVPAGYDEPKLPNREHWISELWIQAFQRLDYPAMQELEDKLKDKNMLVKSVWDVTTEENNYFTDPKFYPSSIGALGVMMWDGL